MENSDSIYRNDFVRWARECVVIRHKLTGQMVCWELNKPQLRVLNMMEEQRKAGKPVRLIMLKARQWGGSTLILLYMAWIQLYHAENWHSLICAHVKDASTTVRGIFETLVTNMSKSDKYRLRPYNGSRNISVLPKRDRAGYNSTNIPFSPVAPSMVFTMKYVLLPSVLALMKY